MVVNINTYITVTAQASLLVSLAFDRFRGSADQPEWPVRRTTTFSWELAPRQFSSLPLFSSRLVFQFNCSINVATLFLLRCYALTVLY